MRQSQKNKQKDVVRTMQVPDRKSADKDVVKTEPDRKRKDDLIVFLPPRATLKWEALHDARDDPTRLVSYHGFAVLQSSQGSSGVAGGGC
ncbi:hypothetical protein KC345_g3820 [Hortaea werneckii]|nr:hypothetical protein KC345_g3820 [Hortaea werneckii]